MTIQMDLHVHTIYSGTGTLTVEKLIEEVLKRDLEYIVITDSGAIEGVTDLLCVSPVRVLPGIELSTEEGHFLIYCEDLKFLDSFGGYLRGIDKIPDREDMAVVWAHPWVYTSDGSRRAPSPDEAGTQHVLSYVHALEVFNGNMAQLMRTEMLSKNYIRDVIELAKASGKGMVGGSDAHSRDRFFLCWTEILSHGDVQGIIRKESLEPLHLIKAIREGRTRPKTTIPEYQPYLSL